MAAEIRGIFKDIFFVSFVSVDASLGIKSLKRGSKSTSSNVRAFNFTLSMSDYNKTI
jgi:hypothetical protein